MPRDGQGNYSLPSGFPFINGTTADATIVNAVLSDIGGAMSASVSRDGQSPATADIPFGGNKATGLKNGTNSQDAATMAQLAQIVGSSRNLRAFLNGASSSLNIRADELVMQRSVGGAPFKVAIFNQTLDISRNNQINGMDGITQAPVSGFVGIYAMYSSTTGMSGLISVDATNAVVPETYSGTTNLGYDFSALVGIWPTDSNRQLLVGALADRVFEGPQRMIFNDPYPVPTPTAVATSLIPWNAKSFSGLMLATNTSGDFSRIDLYPAAAGIGQRTCYVSNSAGTSSTYSNFDRMPIVEPRTFYRQTVAGITPGLFYMAITGYVF